LDDLDKVIKGLIRVDVGDEESELRGADEVKAFG
jgi:hypothetical protein